MIRQGLDIFEADRHFLYPPGFQSRRWQNECLDEFSSMVESVDLRAAAPHVFTVCAGVGSGKTNLAAMLSVRALNRDIARRIVYVAPNRAIARAVKRAFARFGIDLASWNNRKHTDGEPVSRHGAIMTYQAMASRPDIQRRLTSTRTLVFFDEIHHLGDKQAWGTAAEEAFGRSAFIVGLTGTPFRSDQSPIPFVRYEPGPGGMLAIVARHPHGFNYPLGRAIDEGYCRKPLFHWLGGDVEITPAFGRPYVIDFKSDVSEETANLRLAGAVRPGSEARLDALRLAVRTCREEGRKLIVFLGGDSTSDTTAIDDATSNIPAELAAIGVEAARVVSVTSNDSDALRKIDEFGRSDADILVSVNMVSEGVDIPELSAALFLTSITAVTTTIQRIGRVLRKTHRDDPIADALLFMFEDPRYVEFSREIEREITREIRARESREREPSGDGEGRTPRQATSIGLSAHPAGYTFNSRFYTEEQAAKARQYALRKGWPDTSSSLGYALAVLYDPSERSEVAL